MSKNYGAKPIIEFFYIIFFFTIMQAQSYSKAAGIIELDHENVTSTS